MRLGVPLIALIAAAALAPNASAATTVSCGEGIAHSIAIANDLSHCPGNGLNVEADGITIDLQGHTISGSTNGSGIEFNLHNGVTVRRGRVQKFGAGVDMGGDHGRVQYVSLYRNTTGALITGDWNLLSGGSVTQSGSNGVFEFGGAHNTIASFTAAAAPQAGVLLQNGSSNTVHRLNVNDVQDGIALDNEANDTLTLNNVVDFGEFGFHVSNGSSGTTLLDNNGSAGKPSAGAFRSGTGYFVDNSSNTTLMRNRAVKTQDGFLAAGVDGVNFTRNYAKENYAGFVVAGVASGVSLSHNIAGSTHRTSAVTGEGNDFGIIIGSGTGTVVADNDANHNRVFVRSDLSAGILVESGAIGTQLLRNVANYNEGNGITAQSSSTTITGNAAARNTGFGIFALPGVTDGGGNHASGNAAGQCTNVFCS